ncbi:inter-alpha-trypsin inhibitor heavy chain H6-like isoform X2 [Vanessa cardui]|uniref:inter-alpha-trypsin inhibitor heavy chain H6-like isoform X2 n=1 Tax=Vanessa cardui TaxID=171605 RepID=UPI001F12D192|nr:inter-alpha-trypsin inhibitor heavy chain H6-like isoform X2 [Vanessa cardui]
MPPRWLSVVCCVSIFVVNGHAAAVPTQDTFVVAKAEGEGTETAETVTEEPSAPIKMTKMEVTSEVSLRYAHTAVVTYVRNPSRRSQQATFHVLLPETAFISGFVMRLSGKSYKAYVKEKEEAKKIYSEAVSQGIGAAHIAAKARDSNHFTVSVNVEPNSEAVFNLTYEELLVRRNGVYNHAINLHPGALVPKMEVTVRIKESQKISLLRVPEVRTGNEIDATENDAHNSKVVIQKSDDEKEATITFTPDLEEQKRLMAVYADKIKESASSSHNWYSRQSEEDKTTGVLGQFVVQYDVIRPEKGEILVNDGYFVHFFAPQELTPLSKLVVFVLDTSGSMSGRKIKQLRSAMHAILADLRPTDYFSIVEFNSNVKVHKLSEALEEPSRPHYEWSAVELPVTIVAPALATPDNVSKAQVIISRLSAGGGTNIHKALDVAVDVINKAYKTSQADSSTDGNQTTTETVEKINDDLQPIIIFLTDGDATMGETNPTRILSYITEKNAGEKKASIYSLAFGQDADRELLRKLSLRNEGFMRQIYEAADAALQLRHFYQQVSSPLLAHVKFVYPPNQVKAGSVTRHAFDAMFAGGETIVAGELEPGVQELEPQVTAFCADDDHHGRKRYEVKNKVKVSDKKEEYLPLERLWAYLSIKQLLDERDAHDQSASKDENSPEKRALAIALKYEFVTPLTSLVVVKPNATSSVDTESADKPAYALPQRPFLQPIFGAVPLSSSFASSSLGLSSGHLVMSGQAYPLALGGADDLELEEEDPELDTGSMHSFGHFYPTTPITGWFTTSAPAPTTTESLEEAYHLQGYSWALNLIDSNTNSLEFVADGKNVTLELSKSSTVPKASDGDSECALGAGEAAGEAAGAAAGEAAGAGRGVCVYLTRCAAARDISADEYRDTYCVVENKFAGVCCPRSKVDMKIP